MISKVLRSSTLSIPTSSISSSPLISSSSIPSIPSIPSSLNKKLCCHHNYYHSSAIMNKKGDNKGKNKSKNSRDDDNDDDDDNDSSSNKKTTVVPDVKLPDIKDVDKKMEAKIGRFVEEIGKIRAGKANPDMFNTMVVNIGGSKMTIKDLGQVTQKSPTQLAISVYDPNMTNMIADTIRDADLGLNPTVSGNNNIAITIPKPSKESRDLLNKTCAKMGEKCKQDVRNVRKDGMDNLKKAKSGSISEDDIKRLSKDIDTLTEKKVEKIVTLLKNKEKEIMTA